MSVSNPLEPWDEYTPIDMAGNLASHELMRWINEVLIRAMGGEGGNLAQEAADDIVLINQEIETIKQTAAALANTVQTLSNRVDAVETVANDAATAAQNAQVAADNARSIADQNKVDLDALTVRIDNYNGTGPIP